MTLLITGGTGFVGQSYLAQCESLDGVVLAKREGRFEAAGTGEAIDPREIVDRSGSLKILHLATLYDPRPASSDALSKMMTSNVSFFLELFDRFKELDPQVFLASSYMELLPLEKQNEYSLSKIILTQFLRRHMAHVCQFYLFDTFGTGDTRGKVADIFIDRINAGQKITVPSADAQINLLPGSVVGRAIDDVMARSGQAFRISNPAAVTLVHLAEMIAELLGKPADISCGEGFDDPFQYLKELPENVVQDPVDLKPYLAARIEERL